MADKNNWKEVVAEEGSVWDRKDPIEGKYINYKEKVGPNESKLYTLKTKEGEVGVWGSTVLDTKFAQIQRNSMVKIEPLGETKSEKSGRTYQDYKVFVIPPAFEEVDDAPINLDDIPFG